MIKITAKIEGMKCPMCEAHVNECVKKAFDVKSVESSHANDETVILAEKPVDHAALQEEIEKMGYKVIEISEEEIAKKGFFASLFGKK